MSNLTGFTEAWAWFWIKRDKNEIYDAVSASLQGGSAPQDALELMAQYAQERGSPSRATVLLKLADDIRNGASYAEGFAKIAAVDDLMLLSISKRTPDPSKLMANIADMSRRRALAVKSAIQPNIYPCVILIMGVVTYVMLGVEILPGLLKVIPENKWPLAALTQFTAAQFLKTWWKFVAAIIVAIFAALIYSLPRWTGPVRDAFDKLPIYGAYKSMAAGSFLYGMTYLTLANTDFLRALDTIKENSSAYIGYQVDKMITRHQSARDSDDMGALDVGFLDNVTVDLLRIVSVKLNPAKAFQQTALDRSEQLLGRIKAAASVSAIALTLIGGLMIVFGVLGTLGNVPTMMDSLLSGARR
jgi:type II secretory pathway component PulF